MNTENSEPNPLKIPEPDMTGQWAGWSQIDGDPRTFFMTNTEARAPFEVLMTGINPTLNLRSINFGSIKQSGVEFSGKTWGYHVYDPTTDKIQPFAAFYEQHGIKETLPKEADYTARFDGRKLTGEFKNDNGKTGRFELWRNFSEVFLGVPPTQPKTLGPLTWDEFKQHVSKYHSRDRVLFRGQHSNRYSLGTSLHRRGRNNLFRYLTEDIERLRHQINAISSHYYQSSGEDLLGLVSLAQHHGFPTPLLDWSESPYVAAFFAFDCLTDRRTWLAKEDRDSVRIFTFDRAQWDQVNRPRANTLRDPCPDFQFTHPPAHNNPRYYPQQSVAAFSTVEDIEGFVVAHEMHEKKCFLTRIDIHASEREKVEDELRFMGITAATLFPGYEGVCQSLSAALF